MEATQEPPSGKSAIISRELFRLKFDLTSRECALQSAKVAEAQLRNRIQELQTEIALLETQVRERDANLRVVRGLHDGQIKAFGEQIVNLREGVWTETRKATSLDRELDKAKESVLMLQKELEKEEESRRRLLQDHISQRQAQERVISDLDIQLELLSRENSRLSDEIVELVEVRELAKKAYEDTLGQLEHWKTSQGSDIKSKDQQIEHLTKALQVSRRHLAQFTTNPTAQFKLISDLYASFVAAEDKIAAFEDREAALAEQQRQGIATIQEFKDQLIEITDVAKEYQEALRIAERDLGRLKRSGNGSLAPSDDIPPLDEADGADLRRELELYKLQSVDEEKRCFLTTVANNPEQFQRLVSMASNEALIWAFVAEHDSEAQVTELTRLKHELRIARSRCLALDNHNQRLCDDWMEVQRTTSVEIDGLKADLQTVLKETGSLKVQVQEVERLKQLHATEITRYREELEERSRQLALEQLHLREISKDFDLQQDEATKQRANLSAVTADAVAVLQERDRLATEKATLEKEVQALRRDVVRLSDTAPNVDTVYWMNESDRVKADLDQHRRTLETVRGDLNAAEDRQTILQERDVARSQNAAAILELDSVRATCDTLRSTSTELREKVAQLEKQCDLELRAHQASVDGFADTRAELTAARARIAEHQLLGKQLSGTVESLSRLNEDQERVHRTESTLLVQERKNNEEWKEAFYRLVQSNLSAGDRRHMDLTKVLRFSRVDNDVLKKQADLAKSEYLSVVAGINGLERTVQRLQVEQRNASAETSRVSDADASLMQKRLDDKKEMLTTALEYTQYLRTDLLDVKDKLLQGEATVTRLGNDLAEAQRVIGSLQAERTRLLDSQKVLQEQLEDSNRRFDTDRQRLEIENLKKSKASLEAQKRADIAKVKDQVKEHFQTQLQSIKSKNAEQTELKAKETARVVEELNHTISQKDAELLQLRREFQSTSESLSKKEQEVSAKLQAAEKKFILAVRQCRTTETKLTAETELVTMLRLDLQESAEKIRRLEAAAAAAHAVQGTVPHHPSVIMESTASPVTPILTRRPTDSSSPTGQPARSTAVVIPHSQPATVQRVTPVPQLRFMPDPYHPPVNPQSQEGRLVHPVPSTSGTSSVVLPSLRRDVSAVGGGSGGGVDDPGSPSTSSSGAQQSRKRALSGLGFERDKRPVKREASPTFSDVTSSTSTGPKIAPVADASLLRARANSTSTGHVNPLFVPPLDHHEPVLVMEESDRAADSSDGNPDGNELNQEGNVTESSDMNGDSAGNQLFDRHVAEASGQEREDDERERNEESVDGEEVDDDMERLERSSEDRLSPPAGMDEEVVSDDDNSNDLPNEAPEFAPEDEESSSGSYDAEDVERPGQSSSGVSSQEPSTSSSRLRPTLPVPLERHHPSGARSPGMALGSARTPGLLSARYDTGDEYGVVPSTPKFPVPRRDDDGNAMPQVPSFFFGGLENTIEDVTASQVPPTPRQPDADFFSQRLEIASEDSSSFQGADDVMDPVPSGSGMHREDSFPNSESGVGSSMNFASQDFDRRQEEAFFTGEASTLHDPAVPSPGSAGSSVEVQSSIPIAGLSAQSRIASPRSPGQRGRPRGSRQTRTDIARGRGAAAAAYNAAVESTSRRPIQPPVASPLTRVTTATPAVTRGAAAARAGRRGTGGRAGPRGRRRTNLK